MGSSEVLCRTHLCFFPYFLRKPAAGISIESTSEKQHTGHSQAIRAANLQMMPSRVQQAWDHRCHPAVVGSEVRELSGFGASCWFPPPLFLMSWKTAINQQGCRSPGRNHDPQTPSRTASLRYTHPTPTPFQFSTRTGHSLNRHEYNSGLLLALGIPHSCQPSLLHPLAASAGSLVSGAACLSCPWESILQEHGLTKTFLP